MSFIATAIPPVQGAEPVVHNDGWFPPIDPAQLRRDCRLDGTATPERLQLAIAAAMWDVNAELKDWQAARLAEGAASLGDVAAPTIAGQHLKELQYRRAIYSHVQAQLTSEWRDKDTLPAGASREERIFTGLAGRIDGFQQQQRWAIADLIGGARAIVELL